MRRAFCVKWLMRVAKGVLRAFRFSAVGCLVRATSTAGAGKKRPIYSTGLVSGPDKFRHFLALKGLDWSRPTQKRGGKTAEFAGMVFAEIFCMPALGRFH